KRRLAPSAVESAWRHACRAAAQMPRHTPGRITLAGYRIGYTDLLTLCPQWHDIFVERSLSFHTESPAPRILDCGANVGLASLFFKSLYPGAVITAFEADPSIARVLAENLAANAANDVRVVSAAVWTREGTLTFSADGADAGSVAASHHDPAVRRIDVPSVRLRDYLDEAVDLLKLDIEGAEAEVLADCAGALGRVRAILLEVHELDPLCRRSADVRRLLTQERFAYAVTHVTPVPRPTARAIDALPRRSATWVEAISAWREPR